MSRPGSQQALFTRFVGAHVAGVAGDTLVAVALSGTLFFNVSISQARSKIGLYLLLTMAPFSLLSPVIGPFLDRRPGARRLVVLISTLGRGAACVAMASAFRTILLYPLAFAILALARASSVARASLVPSLVTDPERLVGANARLQKTAVIGGALAAAPGILVLKLGSEAAVLLFAAGVYGVGALAALALPRPPREGPAPGLEPILHLGRIRIAAEVQALVRALAGYLLFLLAFSLRRRGISSAGFGFVLAFAGLGGFAGAVAVPRLRRSGNEEWIVATALFLGGGAALIAGRSFGLDLAMVLAGVVGVIGSATRLAFDSIVQREAPEAARGRVFSRFETLFQIAWVIGAAVPVAFNIPIGPGLVAATVVYAGTAVFFLGGIGASGRARIVQPPDEPTV